MDDFSTISRKEIVKNVKTKTDLLVGTVEGYIMLDVSKSLYADLPFEKSIEIIKGAGHDISNKKYFEAIRRGVPDFRYYPLADAPNPRKRPRAVVAEL